MNSRQPTTHNIRSGQRRRRLCVHCNKIIAANVYIRIHRIRCSQIQDHGETVAVAFEEVWNLQKPITGSSGWTLAGIQQVA